MIHPSQHRYAPDHGLSVRIGITAGALACIFLAIVVALIVVGLPWYGVLACAASVMWLQWALADQLVISATGAQVVSAEQAPQLHASVDRLCALANLPKPRIAVQQSDIPNAFAAGVRPDRALVCFTTGLLNELTPAEVEAVAAHELAHIAHRDVVVMTVSSTATVISGFLMKIAAATAVITGVAASADQGPRNRDAKDNNSGYVAMFFLFAVTVMIVSAVVYAINALLLLALSRYRELAADRAAVLLTGRPTQLASALTRISGTMAMIPAADLRAARPMNALSIAPALSGDSSWGWLLSSHPSLHQRLDNIAKAAAQLGGGQGTSAPRPGPPPTRWVQGPPPG